MYSQILHVIRRMVLIKIILVYSLYDNSHMLSTNILDMKVKFNYFCNTFLSKS